MRKDIYRTMALAVACNLPCDEAYDLVLDTFIDDFSVAYQTLEEYRTLTVVDAMILFSIRTLSKNEAVDRAALTALRKNRDAVIELFIKGNSLDMLTQLVGRDTILNEIQGVLRSKNKSVMMYSKLNSNRVHKVFDLFLEAFRVSYSYGYEWQHSLKQFVMHCFNSYFYPGHKKDIWGIIREVDVTRQEIEKNVVNEKTLTVQRSDDLLIHDLMINISVVADLMFMHSGQSDSNYGIKYDLFYLLICELCRERVDAINKSLGYEDKDGLLEFVDPRDRDSNLYGNTYNKGISAKIRNAREIVSYIFDIVRNGKLSTFSLSNIRDKAFSLGKTDDEGSNSVWRNISKTNRETSRFLDLPQSGENYEAFDKILKGVVSAYTLMTELESKGVSLVEMYNPSLFLDKDVIRYLDYLSSLACIPLMKKLQSERIDLTRYTTDLLTFDAMVDEYAGSWQNLHDNIRENRYYAITYGFLVKPKLKKSTAPVSAYEILRVIADVMNAVPHSCKEYIIKYAELKRPLDNPSSYMEVKSDHASIGSYSSLYYNIFVCQDVTTASYYLFGKETGKEDGSKEYISVKDAIDTLDWDLVNADYDGMTFCGVYGVYVPLEDVYFMYDFENVEDSSVFAGRQVEPYTANPQTPVAVFCGALKHSGIVGKMLSKFVKSMSFPWYIGLSNLESAGIPNVNNITHAQSRKYVNKFYLWLDENSRLENSFTDILRAMFTEAVFLCSGTAAAQEAMDAHLRAGVWDSKNGPEDQVAYSVLQGLLSGRFESKSLTLVLQRLQFSQGLKRPVWTAKRTSSGVYWEFGTKSLNTSLIPYLFEDMEVPEYKFYAELVQALSAGSTPAERFVLAYNHLYTKLHFLRYLRDSYSLLLSPFADRNASFVCELNQRIGVTSFWNKYRDGEFKIDYGAILDTMDGQFLLEEMRKTQRHCYQEFQYLIDELFSFVGENETTLSKLIDYNVIAQNDSASRFVEWGNLFMLSPDHQGIPELDNLRRFAVTDNSGFFMAHNMYLRIQNGEIFYYIHRSGRVLSETRGKLKPVNINPDSDKEWYRNLLSQGLQNIEGGSRGQSKKNK